MVTNYFLVLRYGKAPEGMVVDECWWEGRFRGESGCRGEKGHASNIVASSQTECPLVTLMSVWVESGCFLGGRSVTSAIAKMALDPRIFFVIIVDSFGKSGTAFT